jgi:hypothetical protein
MLPFNANDLNSFKKLIFINFGVNMQWKNKLYTQLQIKLNYSDK